MSGSRLTYKKQKVFMKRNTETSRTESKNRHDNAALIDFTKGDVTKNMLTFAAPLFASNMLQAVYNLVDMIVVGHFVGRNGLSAVSIGGDLLSLLTFLAMGFSNAGQVIIAQNIGAGRKNILHKIIGNLFTFLLSASVVLSLVSLCIHNTMLGWMNTPREAWAYASGYMMVCSAGLLFIYGYNAVSAVLRGMGDSRHPFLFVGTAALINVVLDLLFVGVFHWAAAGAALATVIGQGFSFIMGAIFIWKNRDVLGLNFTKESFRPKSSILIPILQLGFPMALKNASVTFSKLFVDSWINSYGIIASSASGIESKLNVITNLFSNAINVSGSTMIGQNIGAGKYDRVPKVMKSAFAIVIAADLCITSILLLFPRAVFSIFTTDEDVIAASMTMIPLLTVLFLSSACRSPNNGLIDGSGNYKLNLLTAIFDGIVNRIGFSMLFGIVLHMGWIGFLWGDAVAGFTPLLIGSIYYFSGRWRTRKYLIR